MSILEAPFIFRILLFIVISTTIVAVFGIIWRVEGRLNKAWKILLVGFGLFWFSILIEIITKPLDPVILLSDTFRLLMAIAFAFGVFEMEALLRSFENSNLMKVQKESNKSDMNEKVIVKKN